MSHLRLTSLLLCLLLALAAPCTAQNPPFLPLVDSAFQNSFFVSAASPSGGGLIYRLHVTFIKDTTSPAGQAALGVLAADAPTVPAALNRTTLINSIAVAHNASRLVAVLSDGCASRCG